MVPEDLGSFDLWDGFRVAAVPGLVLLNGFFVAAEFALVAVRRTQVEQYLRQGNRGAASLDRQIRTLDAAIAATQLGITIASLLLGWIGEPALFKLIVPLFDSWAGTLKFAIVHTIASAFAIILITTMHVVLGELAPKAMALQQPGRVALWVARPLELFTRLTRPVVIVMNGLGNMVVRGLGFKPLDSHQQVHSVEELVMLVEETGQAGLLTPEQADYVQNVFRLSTRKVRDCLIPRDKMAALDLALPPEKILEAVRDGAHTRMPVYEGTLDHIVGIVNTKDLFHLFSLQGVVILHDALYPASFLNPDQTVADALRLFRKTRRPMAIVRDAAGTVLGVLTLEDVLEEIVGDIEDEHDIPGPRVSRRSLSIAAIAKPQAQAAAKSNPLHPPAPSQPVAPPPGAA